MSNIELTYINAGNALTCSNCEEMTLQQPQLLLLSGIAGIGKVCFLQKCVYSWEKNLLWKNVDLVLYFEFIN